ncbi:hypothetical protein MTR67_033958 [Solanum verrucosum]|uniref:RNase H type-1 domain-containing protein n=1 Tax=Solanum verrucosum TaxID=315347 RepID=A0AAF0U7B6_SOLVR|nr:hypothetical protein MTR67_033958 [Solanum verrucosum]
MPMDKALKYYYLACNKTGKKGENKEIKRKWIPPEIGLTLNIDGSFDYVTKSGGAGGVLRDILGNWVAGFAAKINVNDALHSEIMALLLGAKLANKMCINTLQIVTYSTQIIDIIKNGHNSYSNIIAECRELLQQLWSPRISHNLRELNEVADLLAKEGAKLTKEQTFVEWTKPLDFVLKKIE